MSTANSKIRKALKLIQDFKEWSEEHLGVSGESPDDYQFVELIEEVRKALQDAPKALLRRQAPRRLISQNRVSGLDTRESDRREEDQGEDPV